MRGMLPKTLILFSTASILGTPALQAEELVLEEILVTAQKRVQTMDQVPAAVSAISGERVNDYIGGAQDIRALAGPVLRHRILTNFHAESEKVSSDQLIDRLLDTIKIPSSGL